MGSSKPRLSGSCHSLTDKPPERAARPAPQPVLEGCLFCPERGVSPTNHARGGSYRYYVTSQTVTEAWARSCGRESPGHDSEVA